MSLFSTSSLSFLLFFFNDPATTEIYTLSLHDALPICCRAGPRRPCPGRFPPLCRSRPPGAMLRRGRSEEHTSELQSLRHLVCRLLLEKKKKIHRIKNNLHPREPDNDRKQPLTHATQLH